MSDIKLMKIKEFREEGYLQELNRTFLHPLGLALQINIDEEGNETLGGIWDYREDGEGIHYNLIGSSKERQKEFLRKAQNIKEKLDARNPMRQTLLGYIVEPIPVDEEDMKQLGIVNEKNSEIE